MKTVIVISKCGAIKEAFGRPVYVFHFKGIVNGHSITSVELTSQTDLTIEVGKEYLLYCNIFESTDGVLIGLIIKGKEITAKELLS